MRLSIAGLVVELAIEVPELRALSLRRYGAFLSEDRPSLRLRVHPRADGSASGPVRARVDHHLLCIDGTAAWARIDLDGGQGEVHAPDLFPLDLSLRSVLVWSVVRRGGVALHAGAVVVDGGAHVFPAHSGRGKSTLAALCGDPLADELVVLLPSRGEVVAHGTPWNTGRPGEATVRGLYDLRWGAPRVEPLPHARAGALLCAHNLALYAEGETLARAAFDHAMQLGARLPAHALWFERDASPLAEAS